MRIHLEPSSRKTDIRAGNQSEARDVDSLTRQARLRALDEHTTGLALAGQGARGAAFAVGFLQGLASLGLLRRIDYLSANSGGGAAAAWLAAWLWRDGGDPANVERQLAPSRIDQARATRQYLAPGEVVDEEPETLRHLRFYATRNPRVGNPSSTDWIRVASWARNLAIHLLALVPILVLIVVAARAIIAVYGILDQLAPLEDQAAQFDSRLRTPFFILGIGALALMFFAAVLALVLALLAVGRSLRDVRRVGSRSHQAHGPSDSVALVNRRICTRVLAATLLLSYCLPQIYHGLALLFDAIWYGPSTDSLVSPKTFIDAALGYFTLLGWPNFLAHALLIGGGLAFLSARISPTQDALVRRKFSVASFVAGATGGVLIVLLEGLYRWFVQLGRLDLAATFIPPLSLLIVVTAVVVAVALAGRAAGDAERAWWAAASATLTKRAICWIAVMATLLYLPGAVFAVGGLARTAIAAVWLGIGAFGVLAGRYVLRRHDTARAGWLALTASIAAQLFFAGLFGAAGAFVSLLANVPSPAAPGGDDVAPFAYYLQGIEGTQVVTLLGLAIGFGLLYSLVRRFFDVNLFSLGSLDAAWLSRCYLGASRPMPAWHARWSEPRDQRVSTGAPSLADTARESELPLRQAYPLTGFDSGDDLDLRALCIGRKSHDDRVYWGPQLLFNATHRRSDWGGIGPRALELESFFLSPLYCGSQSFGYARTENATPSGDVDPNLSLGRALGISSAAGNPSDSPLSRPVTALLTLACAQPGAWLEKPKPDGWSAAGPSFGDLPVATSFGSTSDAGDFVFLTGGDDFERLGVYELIRRRCRYIIAVDAGEYGSSHGAGLESLIERCRLDFGLRVDVDALPRNRAANEGASSVHVTVGQIHYEDVDQGGTPGVLIYVEMFIEERTAVRADSGCAAIRMLPLAGNSRRRGRVWRRRRAADRKVPRLRTATAHRVCPAALRGSRKTVDRGHGRRGLGPFSRRAHGIAARTRVRPWSGPQPRRPRCRRWGGFPLLTPARVITMRRRSWTGTLVRRALWTIGGLVVLVGAYAFAAPYFEFGGVTVPPPSCRRSSGFRKAGPPTSPKPSIIKLKAARSCPSSGSRCSSSQSSPPCQWAVSSNATTWPVTDSSMKAINRKMIRICPSVGRSMISTLPSMILRRWKHRPEWSVSPARPAIPTGSTSKGRSGD